MHGSRHHPVDGTFSLTAPARLRLHRSPPRPGRARAPRPAPAQGIAGAAVLRQLRRRRRRPAADVPAQHAGRVRDRAVRAAAGPGSACSRWPAASRSTGTGDANPYTLLRRPELDATTRSPPTCCWSRPARSQLIGRAGTQHAYSAPAGLNAYYLRVTNTGAWSILRNNTSGTLTTLASGTVAALGHRHLAHPGADASTARTITAADRRHHRRHGHRRHVRRRPGRLRRHRLPDRPVRQPVGHPDRRSTGPTGPTSSRATAPAAASTSTAAPAANGTQVADVGLQRRRQPAVDQAVQRHHRGSTASAWTSPAPSTANGTLIDLWTATAAPTSSGSPSNGDAGQPGLRQVPRRHRLSTANGTRWSSGPATAAPTSSGRSRRRPAGF